MNAASTPVHAATQTALAHGLTVDRCVVLQDANTLVLKLSETLVARVVQDKEGPRMGTEWFQREGAIAAHLSAAGAPVIPLHPGLPAGPHEREGYTMNFWEFVTATDEEPSAETVGRTMHQCHRALATLPVELPQLAIVHESLRVLAGLAGKEAFTNDEITMLREWLEWSIQRLAAYPSQPLHGDAHLGNLMSTTRGLLWTDWEDGFAGPVEWDVASILWNKLFLDQDLPWCEQVLAAHAEAGGSVNQAALVESFVARAAVVCAWYPVLYPQPNADRQEKLRWRMQWLAELRLLGDPSKQLATLDGQGFLDACLKMGNGSPRPGEA
jgi:thiamine kinase-like enzyme